MFIGFYDANGGFLCIRRVDADNHWDACVLGLKILDGGSIRAAEDFQVMSNVEILPLRHIDVNEENSHRREVS